MSLLSAVYKYIPFKFVKRKIIQHYIKRMENIRFMMAPKNQIEFKEIFKPLYDLIIDIPDITNLDFNALRTARIKSDMESSNELLELINSIKNGDLIKINPKNNPGVLFNEEVFLFSEWMSNRESLQLIIYDLGDLLENAIKITTLNDLTPENIPEHQKLLDDDDFNDELFIINSWEFKKVILKGIKLISFLLQHYKEEKYGKET